MNPGFDNIDVPSLLLQIKLQLEELYQHLLLVFPSPEEMSSTWSRNSDSDSKEDEKWIDDRKEDQDPWEPSTPFYPSFFGPQQKLN